MAPVIGTPIDSEAALPTPGYRFEKIPGPCSLRVAERVQEQRADLYDLMSRTNYWLQLVEHEFPVVLLAGGAIADDEPARLRVDALTHGDLDAVQGAIDAARWITDVRLHLPDDD